MDRILDKLDAPTDPRVKDWFLTNYYSPVYLSLILLTYLLSAYIVLPSLLLQKTSGSLISRIPVRVDSALQIFNGLLVLINFSLGFSYLYNIRKCSFSPWCQAVRLDRSSSASSTIWKLQLQTRSSGTEAGSTADCENNLASLQWWYFISKVVELLDVVFARWRRTPLPPRQFNAHVYHHTTMLIFSWAAAKYLPGGSSATMSSVNCQMHVLLYCYYFLTSIGLPLFFTFKSILTLVTLVQFGIVILVSVTGMILKCGYPPFGFFTVILLVTSYLEAFFGCFSFLFNYLVFYLSQGDQDEGKETRPDPEPDRGSGQNDPGTNSNSSSSNSDGRGDPAGHNNGPVTWTGANNNKAGHEHDGKQFATNKIDTSPMDKKVL